MNKVIQCENLTHYYGDKRVFEDLSFDVEEGRILGLLGKNGTGKTTTINILNGFLKPRAGECFIYGEDSQNLSPATKKKIGYLIEGHIQYSFMNVHQIEKFYSAFYNNWNADAYWDLIKKLDVSPRQKISTMSCGQRSQVSLGLILAQDPDLLILDDFSMGLDPGYRSLFIDYLRAYAKENNKTIFVTSHIIQDMERLIDDVLILDYNKVLAQMPVEDFMKSFKQYTFKVGSQDISFDNGDLIQNIERVKDEVELYTYASEEEMLAYLKSNTIGYSSFKQVKMELEEAFIGLTGKY